MAGSYPDVPSEKIHYDADGTVVWSAVNITAGVGFGGTAQAFTAFKLPPLELSSSVKRELNDEDSVSQGSYGGPGSEDIGYAWVFPEKRDIFGFFGHVQRQVGVGAIVEIDASTDTKNGITGTFVPMSTTVVQPDGGVNLWSVEQSYREFVQDTLVNSTGVRSVRARMEFGKAVGGATDPWHVRAFHWYGAIADGANPDRVLFIDDDTGLVFDEVQDWGDIPRGSQHDKAIYLRNNSATLSASSNVLSFEALYEDSDEWYTLLDPTSTAPSFSTGFTVDGPIAPGGRYPSSTTFTLRLTVADDENLGPASARLRLFTGTWS